MVTWLDTGFDRGTSTRFTGSTTFLNTINGYTFSFSIENISTAANARWGADISTLNGGATTTVDGFANTPGNNASIGQVQTVGVVVTDYAAYNRQNVPNDVIGVRFRRPASITGTAFDFPDTITFDDQPTWTYPVFWIVSDSNTTPPEFVTSGNRILFSPSRTRTISDLSAVDVTANAVGEGTRYVWVAYTTGSPTITSIDVRTRRGTADATSPITLSTAQQSSTDLMFINPDPNTPADAAELYKWFWIEVPEQDRVTLGTVRT